MPNINFVRSNLSPIVVESGANLMSSLVDKDIPVASSCGGEGICSKCKIQIISGMENLSKESLDEIALKQSNNVAKDCRISCQTTVTGDIVVDASYW